jgi:hypothetical protein
MGIVAVSPRVDNLIATRGNPFLPLTIDLSGGRNRQREEFRVFGAEATLLTLLNYLRGNGSVIVSAPVQVRRSAYLRADGSPASSGSLSTDVGLVRVYVNARREWRTLLEFLGEALTLHAEGGDSQLQGPQRGHAGR